jgi:hypothetical protein
MMNIFSNRHSKYEMLLTEHLDGVISADDDARLTRHLSTCRDCAADLREQSQIRTLLRAQPLVAAPRSFALPYAPRTVDTSEPGGITKLLRSMQMATAAAAMVLVALVGLNVMQTSPTAVTQTSLADAAAPMAESSTAPDDRIGATATGEATEEADGTMTMMAAPSTDTQFAPSMEPFPGIDVGVTERMSDTTLISPEVTSKTEPLASVLPGDLASEPALAGDTPPTATDDRTALEWALLAASLVTALLALSVVAATWRSRRLA